MLRGHVFKSQTFANEVFGLFIDTFLQGNMGVVRGCALSNTNATVTIGEGYFDVKGRFLQILGNETVNISDNGYYSLICEIDLTKENTSEDFLQGEIKAISGVSAYPSLTQQDINSGGTMYQYEFARFRKTDNGIIDFTDRRTFLNLESIYTKIDTDTTALLEQIEEALNSVLDESIYLLKTDAERDYLLKDDAEQEYLSQTDAAQDYVQKSATGNIISRNYSIGTGTPSGGSNGDIYDQYFN